MVDGYEIGSCGNYSLTVDICAGDPLACPPTTVYSHPYSSNFGTAATSEVSPGYRMFDEIEDFSGLVCNIHFWGLKAFFSGGWAECAVDEEPMLFNVAFWPDVGGYPDVANPICQYNDIPATGTDTGVPFAFTTIWRFDIPVLDPCCQIAGGWVSIQGAGDPNCWFLWLNTLDAPGDNRSVQQYPDGSFVDQPWDVVFCLTGEYVPTYGACCDDATGDCVDGVEWLDCQPPLRFAADILCANLDPPCGQITGACCFPDGSCLELTSADCAAQQGDYQGNGTTCDPNPCPQPPPPNDFCQDAIHIDIPGSVQGNTEWATPEALGTCVTTDGTGGAVWYHVVGTGNTITATTCNDYSDYDTKIRVWCYSCDDLICVTGNDDDCDIPDFGTLSTVSWCSAEGEEYWILVHGWSTQEGNFQLDVFDDGVPCSPPPQCEPQNNDDCSNYIDLGVPPVTTSGNSCGFVNNYGPFPAQPDCWQGSWFSSSAGSPDVTYKVTLDHDGEYTFTLCNSVGYDQAILLYDFTCPTEPIYPDDFVCGNDDLGSTNCPGYSLRAGLLCLPLTAGEYLLVVDGYGSSNCGNFVLDIFECVPPPVPCDPAGGDIVYSNGFPYDDYGSPASQYASDYPFAAGAADDFILDAEYEISRVETWTTHWNGAEGQGPNLYTGINVTIYANYFDPDVGYDMPGGYLDDAGVRQEYEAGGVIQTELVSMDLVSFFPDPGCTGDRWYVDIPITPICLSADTRYWLEVQPEMVFTGGGQSAVQLSDANTGLVAEQIFPALGLDPWAQIAGNGGSCPDTDPAGTWRDLAFCLHGTDCGAPPCVYIPGDCDCSGTPLELTDVTAMIFQYRGLADVCYTCPCPTDPPQPEFPPHADPNGNCVALELSDVTTEIFAYRGLGGVDDCDDCPAARRIAPGGDGGTTVVPSLKSKVKIIEKSGAD